MISEEDLARQRRLVMSWSPEELASVDTLVLGPVMLGFFEGTSGWHGEMAEGDRFDLVIDAVFHRIRYAPRSRNGRVRIELSTRQVEAVLYYADVMLGATDPANTGDDDRREFVAAKRLIEQITKKWPEAKL